MEDGGEAVMGAAGEKGSAERSYEKVSSAEEPEWPGPEVWPQQQGRE